MHREPIGESTRGQSILRAPQQPSRSERLSDPCSDRQPLSVGRSLYFSILGIL
jgi:hypothetical protein